MMVKVTEHLTQLFICSRYDLQCACVSYVGNNQLTLFNYTANKHNVSLLWLIKDNYISKLKQQQHALHKCKDSICMIQNSLIPGINAFLRHLKTHRYSVTEVLPDRGCLIGRSEPISTNKANKHRKTEQTGGSWKQPINHIWQPLHTGESNSI